MEYRYTANLLPFIGEDVTIEDNCFKRIFKIVMSEARAAGCNLSGFKIVFIRDNKTLRHCGISNWDGYIAVSMTDHATLVRPPREVR